MPGKLKFSIYAALILICVAILLNGCGAVDRHITIGYQPLIVKQKIENADTVTINVIVSDLRKNKSNIVGKVAQGFKFSGNIYSKEDVVVTIAKAIELELINCGFELGSGQVTISIVLRNFYYVDRLSREGGYATGEFSLLVEVLSSNNEKFFSKFIIGRGKKKPSKIFAWKGAPSALEAALKDGISQVINETEFINSLFRAANKS